MKWLYCIISLLYGCRHRWEVRSVETFQYEGMISRGQCHCYILQCKRCGMIRRKLA